MSQINIRISENRKQKWKDYAEESLEAENLSHLVRQAVEEKISDGGEASSGTGEIPDDVATSQQVSNIEDTLLRVVDRLDSMEDRIRNLEHEKRMPDDPGEVIRALPPEEPETGRWERWKDKEDPSTDEIAVDGRAETVAQIADERVSVVEYFLDLSRERSDDFHVTEVEGEKRYWRSDV